MKEEEMNNAEICWLALLGGIVLVVSISNSKFLISM